MAIKLSDIQFAITSGLHRFVQSEMRNTNTDCIIIGVDESTYSCTLQIQDTKYFNVPLRVLINSQASVVEIPKLKTNGIVCFLDNNHSRPKLLEIHEVEKLLLKIGDSTLEITTKTFTFNGGENDGFVKVKELTEKLNNLEIVLNNFISSYNSHKHTVFALPNPLLVPLPTAITANLVTEKLIKTKQTELENTKIKH
jgi:hypothetical protein